MSGRRGLAVIVAMVITLIGCGSGAAPSASTDPATGSPLTASPALPSPTPASIGTLTISDTDCTLSGVTSPVAVGHTRLTAVNEASVQAAFDLWLIGEGHTYTEFVAATQVEIDLTNAGEPFVGPPSWVGGLVSSGLLDASSTTTIDGVLSTGTYGIVCLRHIPALEDDVRVVAIVGPMEVR